MPLAAENTAGIVAISLVFLVLGYLAVGGLWYLMVVKPGREERRRREDDAG